MPDDDLTPPPSPPPSPPPPSPLPPSDLPPPAPPTSATTIPLGSDFTAPAYGSGKLSASDDKTFCVLAHVLGIVAGFLAPLIVWLIKKDESPAVDAHGKEALNFQITIAIAFIISFVLSAVSCGFLFFLPLVVWIYNAVMCVIATMKANEGLLYRYPGAIRLVK